MQVKVMAAVVAAGNGEKFNVSGFCDDHGVSRKTFYKWVKRYLDAGGLEGLGDRSRRPHSNPNQTPVEVEDQIVRLRKELADGGLDHGATTIQWHLGEHGVDGGHRVPSVSTIHRILVRRGLVVPEPSKRPNRNWRRFEAPGPNELWQIDFIEWPIATGMVKVFNIIDDHSRVATRSRAVEHATTEAAWIAFGEAAQVWGLPAGTLSDNGLCFSGKLRQVEVGFEANLRDAGVRPICGRPFHPQTTGKVERFQQTLKKWLRNQPLANDLAELQAQLDQFCRIYNHERPHQGIGRRTPVSKWQATPAAGPAAGPLEHPDYSQRTEHHHVVVAANGQVACGRNYAIGLGKQWAGQPATVIADNTHAMVYINNQLVRHVKLDPTRRYQPLNPRPAN